MRKGRLAPRRVIPKNPTIAQIRSGFSLSRKYVAEASREIGAPVSAKTLASIEEGHVVRDRALYNLLATLNAFAREYGYEPWTMESINWQGSDARFKEHRGEHYKVRTYPPEIYGVGDHLFPVVRD